MHSDVLVWEHVTQGASQIEHKSLDRKELAKQVRHFVELVVSQVLQFEVFLQGLHLPSLLRYDPNLH